MRRMNYNPFETPFASGEYDPTQERFVVDRNIEVGAIYYVRIVDPDSPFQTIAILDTSEYGELSFNSTPFQFADINGEIKYFYLSLTSTDTKYISVVGNNPDKPSNTVDYHYLIYIYKIV